MVKLLITVRLKTGVLDAEGTNTKKTLKLLGFKEVDDVKTVKVYEIYIAAKSKKEARELGRDICEKLLANPVIHDYEIVVK